MQTESLKPKKTQIWFILIPVVSMLFYISVMLDIWPTQSAVVMFVAMNLLLFATVISCFIALLERQWLPVLLSCLPIFLLTRYVFS